MAEVRLSDLYGRTAMIRSDLLQEQGLSALMDAARELAKDTGLLTDVTLTTVFKDEWDVTLALPAGRTIRALEKVEAFDNGRWRELQGPDNNILRSVVPPESMDSRSFSRWAAREGHVIFDCPSLDKVRALRITLSWVPSQVEMPEAIDIPLNAERAIILLAQGYLLQIAGPGQNLALSERRFKDYRAELPLLVHLAQEGPGTSDSVNSWLPFER